MLLCAPNLKIVSPPTLRRSGFDALNASLAPPWGPFGKSWLRARFDEGLQIRMMMEPCPSYIAFFAGGSGWHLIENAGNAIIIHAVALAEAARHLQRAALCQLWSSVEGFARYYDYSTIVMPVGQGGGLTPEWMARALSLTCVAREVEGVSLYTKIIEGPAGMPCFKDDTAYRRQALGGGLVIQDGGMTQHLQAVGDELLYRAMQAGLAARRDKLISARDVAARGAAVAPAFGVYLDGIWLGGAETPPARLWQKLCSQRNQSPS